MLVLGKASWSRICGSTTAKEEIVMIGLSLSFCIRDIVAGRVQLDQVDRLVTGTRASDEDEWDEVIAQYKESYWRDCPDEAERLVRQLRAEGRIEQPRVAGNPPPHIALGHWVEDESQIQYCVH